MARIRSYDDEDKARVLAALMANDGNVKRTARDTEIPEGTIRVWKKQAEKGALSPGVEEALPVVAEEIAADFKRVRDAALLELERQIDAGEVKGQALVTAVGVLTDKLRVIEGLATSRTEHVSTGPSPEEFGAQLLEYLEQTAHDAELREADIVDADVVEQAQVALPPPQS